MSKRNTLAEIKDALILASVKDSELIKKCDTENSVALAYITQRLRVLEKEIGKHDNLGHITLELALLKGFELEIKNCLVGLGFENVRICGDIVSFSTVEQDELMEDGSCVYSTFRSQGWEYAPQECVVIRDDPSRIQTEIRFSPPKMEKPKTWLIDRTVITKKR